MQIVQKLPQRVAFAVEMLSCIENEYDFLNLINCSDGATLQVSNKVNISTTAEFGAQKRLTNTYVVIDCLFHDVSGFIGHNGATTSTTILSLPGPSKPVADEQMEEVRAVLENDSSTSTSFIEEFPKTIAF
ncbi:hypothetical protein AVEN_12749-1 [Araneus ventricosus]|uniref:Uncharacterized protein n=1 Tax=Araneus ventricosus TaxID=182803 RepID=A0A4Y2ABY0_ARAVE|nr:hypothetical protein AVEN_12749-1 [Araneus ventricosus]